MGNCIATITKNAREELRVSIDNFHGRDILNMRVWFEADDGTMRPSKKDVAVRLDLLPELRDALDAACQEVV